MIQKAHCDKHARPDEDANIFLPHAFSGGILGL